MRNSTGFTLIELMITVVIIAILAAIALPSYRQYLLQSHRLDATTALTQVQMAQERYRGNNTNYAPDFTTLGTTPSSSYYSFSMPSGSYGQDQYSIVATAIGNQASDTACAVIQITQTTSDLTYTPSACWSH